MTRFASLLLASLAFTLPVSADEGTAQTADDADRAERLFKEATDLADAGKYEEACPKFEESQKLDAGLGTQFNLAVCLEKIGKLGAAYRNFEAVTRLAHATGKKGREDAARQKLDALKPHVPHLVIKAADSDVFVRVDGQPLEPDALAFFVVDPGSHKVQASAPGKTSWETMVSVPEGEAGATVNVDVPKLVVPPSQVVVVEHDTTNSRRVWSYAIGGFGLAGVATAIITGIVILDKKAIADQECTPECTERGRSAVNTGNTLMPINAIAWGVGIVGVGVGVFLFATSFDKKKSSPTKAELIPLISPQGAGVLWTRSF